MKIISRAIIYSAISLYLLLIIPSGLVFCQNGNCGMHFWGIHIHDAMWHIAIAETSLRSYPPVSPIYSDSNLAGYNYFFDYLIKLLNFFGISSVDAYFRVLPIIWTIIFSKIFINYLRRNKVTDHNIPIYFATIFFTSSFAYVIQLLHHGSIWGSAGLLSNPILHLASNAPFSFSLLVIIGILVIVSNKNRFTIGSTCVLLLLTSVSLALKFYAGFAAGWVVFWFLITSANSYKQKLMAISALLLTLVVTIMFWYQPRYGEAPIFTFSPFSLVHRITEEPSLLYSEWLTNARYSLQASGSVGPRLILIEAINFILHHIVTYGVRLIGLVYTIYLIKAKKAKLIDWILGGLTITMLAIPSLFIQRGEWWNIMQFGDYASFFMALYLARFLVELANSKKILLNSFVVLILIIGSINQIDLVRVFAYSKPSATISETELMALSYLKTQEDGVVATDMWRGRDYNSPYIPALTGKRLYFDDLSMLKVTGVDYHDRHKKLLTNPCSIVEEADYLYSTIESDVVKLYQNCTENLLKIYSLDNVIIYKLIKPKDI